MINSSKNYSHEKKYMQTIILFVFVFFSRNNLFGFEINSIRDNNINQYLTYFVDESQDLKLHQIIDKKDEFKSVNSNNLVFTPQPTSVWIRLKAANNQNHLVKKVLNFSPPYLGSIEIYDYNQSLLLKKIGSLNNSSDELRSMGLAVELDFHPGDTDYLIHLKSIGSALSVKMIDKETFIEKRNINEILFSFVIGCLLILALYHFSIFQSSKKLIYVYYSGYILSVIGFQFSMTGFSRYFLSTKLLSFPFSYLGSLMFANFIFYFMSKFIQDFLQTKTSRKLDKLFDRIAFISIVSVVFLFLTHSFLMIVTTRLLALILVASVIYTTIKFLKEGNQNAKYLLISWSPVFFSIIIVVLVLSGIIAETQFTYWSAPFGIVFQSLFLAMAIGKQVDRLSKEKIEEQSLKLDAYKQIEENFVKMKERDNIIRTYVCPTILTEVALGKDPLSYVPKNLNKTIMFTDLRNYTQLTEKSSPQESFEILNSYFKVLNDGIFMCEGEVDKLIGDAVMATFSSSDNSISAYNFFKTELHEINRERIKNDKPLIQIGCGASFGEVLSANFGSNYKLDRTIIGDAVNIAARFESLTKEYKVNFLVTDSYINQLSSFDMFRPIDYVKVKRKTEATGLYEIFSDNPKNVIEYKLKTKKILSEVIELKKIENNREALALLETLITHSPEHNYSKASIDPTLLILKTKLIQKIEEENYGKKTG